MSLRPDTREGGDGVGDVELSREHVGGVVLGHALGEWHGGYFDIPDVGVVKVFAAGDGLDGVEDGVVVEAAGMELEVVLLDAQGVVAETGDGGLGVEFVTQDGRVNVGGGVGGRGEAAEKQLGGKGRPASLSGPG